MQRQRCAATTGPSAQAAGTLPNTPTSHTPARPTAHLWLRILLPPTAHCHGAVHVVHQVACTQLQRRQEHACDQRLLDGCAAASGGRPYPWLHRAAAVVHRHTLRAYLTQSPGRPGSSVCSSPLRACPRPTHTCMLLASPPETEPRPTRLISVLFTAPMPRLPTTTTSTPCCLLHSTTDSATPAGRGAEKRVKLQRIGGETGPAARPIGRSPAAPRKAEAAGRQQELIHVRHQHKRKQARA